MSKAPELLLAHHLKTLRLPTFLREHDKQARICAAEGLDHVRYLARLTELELIDRETRAAQNAANNNWHDGQCALARACYRRAARTKARQPQTLQIN